MAVKYNPSLVPCSKVSYWLWRKFSTILILHVPIMWPVERILWRDLVICENFYIPQGFCISFVLKYVILSSACVFYLLCFLDHFVKITLLRDDLILDKRRTRVVKKTSSPIFNDRFMFPVDQHGVRNLVFLFEVIRYDSKLKQEKIGNVLMGNNSQLRQVSPQEIQHFNDMIVSPQRQIAEWHKLFPPLWVIMCMCRDPSF